MKRSVEIPRIGDINYNERVAKKTRREGMTKKARREGGTKKVRIRTQTRVRYQSRTPCALQTPH